MDPVHPGRRQEGSSAPLDADVAAYIAGSDEAGGRVCAALGVVIREEVRRFLSESDADHDDVIQDTLLRFLEYLRRAGQAPESPLAFIVTMAGNRCRNLYRWRQRRPGVDVAAVSDRLPSPGADPLQRLETRERDACLRTALCRLEAPCRKLLLEIYANRRPMQEVREEAGLSTVQGAHYRKYVCLRKLARLLNELWSEGREGGSQPAASGSKRR